MFLMGCGVFFASAAFAAEQPAAASAGEAAATAPQAAAATEKPKDSGLLDSLFTKLAPKFGGDANIEYDGRDSNFGDGLTSRVRLTMDADIDPLIYIHTRLTAKGYISGAERQSDGSTPHPAQAAGYENQAIKVGMEQLYLGLNLAKISPALNGTELRVGRQPLWLANGMLADINGIDSAMVRASLHGVNVMGIWGYEGTEGLTGNNGPSTSNNSPLYAAELSTTLGPVELGATFLKVHDGFYGFNANYATPIPKLVLFGQFAQDIDSHNHQQDLGYWAGARYGNAGKKGEWDLSLAYVNVGNDINPNGQYLVNDGNLVGARGARLKGHYALSNWSTLTLVQDFTNSTVNEKQQWRTDVELEVRF
jgi:hypothetical protein